MEQWFRPMGLNLRVSTNAPELAAAVCEAYDLFGGGDETAPVDLRFDFAQGAEPSAAEPNYRLSGEKAELRTGDRVVLSVDTASGLARGCFPGNLVADRSFFRLHALHFALSAALPGRGFLGVHAACIAINGVAVLVRGPRGSGKTVLTYAAALRGFQVIADSTVWIAPDEVTWWGIPRWVYLRPSAQALFPEIAAGPTVSLGGEVKVEVDLARISAAVPLPCMRCGIIVYLERQAEETTSLKAIPESQALRLWSRGAAGNEVDTRNYQARVTRLLREPCYRLDSADDIHRALELIAAAT
ncbi:MAG TPA: hypothetical protein VHU83_18660 [Bryobacteraceae bacterium]|jgi:hypothetical protein|nr:hypothetical protein [Bryobacteraceae bacterium]